MSERRGRYRVTFAVLATACLAFSLLQSLVVPAIPAFERALGVSETGATWLLTGYLLSAAVATPILGRVGDMVGKGKMLVVVLLAVCVGTLVSALATGLPVMLVGRVIQGLGGAIFPLAFGIIRDEFPPRRVTTGIGMLSAILGIGIGLGIVLAGPLIEHLSYHWLYWIPLFLSAGATLAALRYVPESPVRAPGRINWVGALLMSGWLVAVLLAIAQAPSWGWTNPVVLVMFAAGAVLLWAWVANEARSSTPLVDMQMMRIPTVWATNLAAVLFGFGMFSFFVTVPQFVQTPVTAGYGFGASVTQSGLYLVPYAATMLVLAPAVGRLSLRIGSKSILVAGSLFSAAAYGVLAAAHSSSGTIYLASGLLGVGMALGYTAMANLIVEAVRADQTGVATGMNTNIRNIGSALGSGVATSLVVSSVAANGYPTAAGYTVSFIVAGISLVVAAAAALKIPRRLGAPTGRTKDHPGFVAEAEVFVGADAFRAEA